MSAALIPYEGYSLLMTLIFRGLCNGVNDGLMHLFTNIDAPAKPWTITNFTEATLPGYTPLILPSAVDNGLNPNNIDIWSIPLVTFGPYAPSNQVIYGYWVDATDPNTGFTRVAWCQKFNNPFFFGTGTDVLPIAVNPGFDQGPTVIPQILTKQRKRPILTTDT